MRALVLAVVLFVAGCTSWQGESHVTTTDGITIRCTTLQFGNGGVSCWRPEGYIKVTWKNVRGYSAGRP